MDIRQQLAVTHSRANADLILDYLRKDQARTQVLMNVLRSKVREDAKLVQRGAMVLGDLGREFPDWLIPYHGALLELASGATHPAIPRAVSRYFSELPLGKVNEAHQGLLLDLSFRYLSDRETTVAVKVFSMTTLYHFTRLHPELKDELLGLIELELEEGGTTPGYISRARRILEKLR